VILRDVLRHGGFQTASAGAVWEYYCMKNDVPGDSKWLDVLRVMRKRYYRPENEGVEVRKKGNVTWLRIRLLVFCFIGLAGLASVAFMFRTRVLRSGRGKLYWLWAVFFRGLSVPGCWRCC